jgi:hypothetical protein
MTLIAARRGFNRWADGVAMKRIFFRAENIKQTKLEEGTK